MPANAIISQGSTTKAVFSGLLMGPGLYKESEIGAKTNTPTGRRFLPPKSPRKISSITVSSRIRFGSAVSHPFQTD